jgi:antitoxin component YwqK of YwqJK toxin-antitoxin module
LNEIKGWESYFDGNKENAKLQFKKAMELDSTNFMAKIGFFNSKTEAELTEKDFELTNNLPKNGDYKDLMFNLMMSNQVDKQLPDSIKIMRNKYDESYIQFKARLTDSEFKVYDEDGEIRQTGAFKNRKPFGTWKKYGYENKLHHSFTFSKETDTVIIKYFTPNGNIARKELTTGMPFTNESKKFKEIIYWQETPGKDIDYLFVSENGFTVFDSENPVVFDESTPDNIIQMKFNPETYSQEAFIWKNGKKIPFEFCPFDGTTVTYLENGVKKSYRWEDCKKIPINK